MTVGPIISSYKKSRAIERCDANIDFWSARYTTGYWIDIGRWPSSPFDWEQVQIIVSHWRRSAKRVNNNRFLLDRFVLPCTASSPPHDRQQWVIVQYRRVKQNQTCRSINLSMIQCWQISQSESSYITLKHSQREAAAAVSSWKKRNYTRHSL